MMAKAKRTTTDERTVATQEMEKIPYGKECMQGPRDIIVILFHFLIATTVF